VVELQVPDEVLEERICGRWIHKNSGRSYHVKYAPPKNMKTDSDGKPIAESMTDDETGELLMQRPDDTASALVKRLDGYRGETVPILQHYAPKGIVVEVNANQEMDGVWGEVLAALKRKSSSASASAAAAASSSSSPTSDESPLSSISQFKPTWQLPDGIENHIEALIVKSAIGATLGAAAFRSVGGAMFGVGCAVGSFVERGILEKGADPAMPKFELPSSVTDLFNKKD